ncbi:hypothetical protein J3459_018312 [Metarhizium acridum]|nr:hypothetical protein J3459_018312 [Metarhizium acridum]
MSAERIDHTANLQTGLDGLSWLHEGNVVMPVGGQTALDCQSAQPIPLNHPSRFGLAVNEDYQANSLPSDSSVGSFESTASTASTSFARRRKRQSTRHSAVEKSFEKRRYQCTFCTDTFKTKFDLQRHESSMHLSLEQWK